MAIDMFMKIEGIDGESTDDKHKNWIELRSFSWGVSQPASVASSTGGRTAGRADFKDFTVTKLLDKSSPNIYLYCANGKHIPRVTIEFCLATGDKHTFMKFVMEDVIVSSASPGGQSLDEEHRPLETVTLNYGKIEWEYTPIDHTGKKGAAIKQGWDLETNKQK